MKATLVASARPAAALRAAPAPRPAARPLVAKPRPLSLSVRTHAAGNVISDIGKYLSEAASQIFHMQADCELGGWGRVSGLHGPRVLVSLLLRLLVFASLPAFPA